jgi:hypothetical protein
MNFKLCGSRAELQLAVLITFEQFGALIDVAFAL